MGNAAAYAVRHCNSLGFASIYSSLPGPDWNFRRARGKVGT